MGNGGASRRGLARRLGVWLLAGLLAAVSLAGAHAQPVPPSAATQKSEPASAALPSPTELESLIVTLESETARKKLLDQLKALKAAREGAAKSEQKSRSVPTEALGALSRRLNEMSRQIAAAAAVLLDTKGLSQWISAQLDSPAARERWMAFGWKIAALVALASIVWFLVRGALAPARRRLENRGMRPGWARFLPLLGRTIVDVLPIAAFGATGYAVLPFLNPGPATLKVGVALIESMMIAQAVMAAGRLLITPYVPALRVAPLQDETAHYLFIWLRRLTYLTVYGYFLAVCLLAIGLPPAGYRALLKILGFAITLLVVILILQNRSAVARSLRGTDTGQERDGHPLAHWWARLAEIWHVIAIVYVVGVYGVWATDVAGGFEYLLHASVLTIVIAVAARLIASGLTLALARSFRISDELDRRFPGLNRRANRYLSLLQGTLSLVVYFVAALGVLESWGVDSFGWLTSPFGQRLTGSLLTIIAVIIASVILWEFINSFVERLLDDREGRIASTRAKTLLPLVRSAVLICLITAVTLIGMSELGINIGPLLAGAGVIGLAIGFGSQTLVKDIVTGIFILIEDQIAVGDVVNVGGHAGLVEAISIRTIRLRDLAGNVHVVPFSEVSTVENMTKDFSRYVFNVGVAYKEDTDHVVEVLKQLGAEMLEDPNYKDLIIQPLEILGVDSFADSAVIIRARITTKPIQQWTVGREFNRRMKKRFDELGIEIPFPHRTIYFGEASPENEKLAPPPARPAPPASPGPHRGDANPVEGD